MLCKTKESKSCEIPSESVTNGELLRDSVNWIVNDDMFANLALHGNIGWQPARLIILAVLWVWSEKNTLTKAFNHARHLAVSLFGDAAVSTYQGLTGALKTYTTKLLPAVQNRMHALMEEVGGDHGRIGKWLPLAVDGSRIDTPRTKSNERHFAAKNYGAGRKAKSRRKWKNKRKRSKKLSAPVKPQIWLTLIWHMGLKMPWTWKTGPSTSSERHHLMDLVRDEEFPENTLFCGDAGFVGYELWSTILEDGHHLLIRVGANVRLLTDLPCVRCREGIVCLWPDAALRKMQPPIVLRLIEVQNERGRMFLVTSVLSRRDLSDSRAVRLYTLRWGIELQFRSFKQTFGRSRLQSRTAECCRIELDWSLAGLWMIQLFAVKEQIPIDSPPNRSSVSLSLTIIQNAMQKWNEHVDESHSLNQQFREAVTDGYNRRTSKTARYHPDQKHKPSTAEPKLIKATTKQNTAYKTLTLAT